MLLVVLCSASSLVLYLPVRGYLVASRVFPPIVQYRYFSTCFRVFKLLFIMLLKVFFISGCFTSIV